MTVDQIAASKRKVKSNPKMKKRMANRVKNAIQKTKMETPQNNENTDLTNVPEMVEVNRESLNLMIEQNSTQKDEIGALVGLFLNFEGLFTGDAGLMSLMSMIPKMLNDPKMKEQIESILPIIQKYK